MPLFARLFRLKIAEKLPIYIVAAGLLVGLSIGISTYISAATSLEQARRDQLATALAGKRATLRSYLEGIENDLTNLASSTMTRSALTWFSEAWEELGDEPKEQLQRIYITENPHPTGQKENLDAGDDGSSYSDTHSLYHPWFRGFLRARGYYDIFLFDADGNLIYTVFKELDYATNLVTGKCEITSQNHGFSIKAEDIEQSEIVEITHINLNDQTVEGIKIKGKSAFSVQYHPESSPGPHDSRYLFDDFIKMIKTSIVTA